MGLREKLQENQGLGFGLAAVVVIAAAVVLYMELRGPTRASAAQMNRSFYSDDDGASWFLDDSVKLSPFDHNGKKAYLASVYRCPSSKQLFVGFLKKIPDKMLSEAQSSVSSDPKMASRWINGPMDMKRPHDVDWTPAQQAMAKFTYAKVNCPGGTEAATPAAPTDPDVLDSGK